MRPKRRMMASITIKPTITKVTITKVTITKVTITKVTTTSLDRFLTLTAPANWCWTFPPKRSPRPIGR